MLLFANIIYRENSEQEGKQQPHFGEENKKHLTQNYSRDKNVNAKVIQLTREMTIKASEIIILLYSDKNETFVFPFPKYLLSQMLFRVSLCIS